MKKQEEVGMLIPNLRSEKGISFYSRDLISSINKKRNIKKIIYNRGNFISLLKTIPKLKKLKIIHIQHENRLFGIMDGIWFPPFIFILGILKRGKIILTFHSVHTKKEKLSSIHPLVTFIKRKFTHPLNYLFANLFCDLFVVHTKFLKEELIKNSKIKGEKIKVIPQGIKKIRKMDKKVCQKKLKMLGKNYLLIGNIGPNKGFDLILKQAEKISGKIFIVGSNDYGLKKEYLNYMKKLVKKKKIENKVKFVIKKNINSKNLEWWEYFSAVDLVLLPYRGGDGSGIFADAMASKTPVISSNLPFFKEISEKSGCLKIVKKESDYPKIIKESMRPKNLKKMIKETQRFGREHDLLFIGKKYQKIYESLIKR